MAEDGQLERPQDAGTSAADEVKRWLREIELSDRHEDAWRKRAQKVIERYRDERVNDEDSSEKRFNILYANTEILKGVVYSRRPIPDVRRRFKDKNPVARNAAQILQRVLSYCGDAYDLNGEMQQARDDVLLPGRGVMRVNYKPTLDGDQVVYQTVDAQCVEWDMFRYSPAKRWSKVRWVAFGELLTRDELEDQFGDKGKECKLDWSPKDVDKEDARNDIFKRALVWTIWNKPTREVIVVSGGYTDGVLDKIEDPLNLENFFPCPKPAYSITTSDSLIPIPEYCQYQDQAAELDEVTERITTLTAALKRRGVYDGSFEELNKLNTLGDNEFIAVESARHLTEKGGMEKAIWTEPIDVTISVLKELYIQREQIKATIYEETGIADIVRGATKASETATAQEIKGRWANARINGRQDALANLARDVLRIKGELIAEKFSPDVLKQITGPDLWFIETVVRGPAGQPMSQKVDATEQIMALLRNDKLRGFAIDIETDSTVLPDSEAEKKARVELMGGLSQFMQALAPAVQVGFIDKDLAKELVTFTIRGFKASPQLEEALDKIGGSEEDKAKQMMAQQKKDQVQQMVFRTEMREKNAKASKDEADAKKTAAEARKAELEIMTGASGEPAKPAEIPPDPIHEAAMRAATLMKEQGAARKAHADADASERQVTKLDTEQRRTELDEASMAQNEEFAKIMLQVVQQMQQTADRMVDAAEAMAQAAKTAAGPRRLVKGKDGSKMSVPVQLQ